jgi:hypothetical protein
LADQADALGGTKAERLQRRRELPAAHVSMMEKMSGGEGNYPQSNDERSDSENPFADGPVVVGEGRRFANPEDLAAKADGYEHDAEREGEPG